MQYNVYFTNLCVDLNVNKGASKEDLLKAYLMSVGGPEGLLNKFFNKCIILPNEIKEVKTTKIKEITDKNSEINKKDDTR